MERGLLLDVVVRKGAAIFQLFACKDQTLLIWGDAFLVLNLCLDIVYCVTGLNIKCDCLPCEGLDKDLHGWCRVEIGFRNF